MAQPTRKRQAALQQDAGIVRTLYEGACARFGKEALAKDLSLLWTYRCMLGVQGSLPFGTTELASQTLGELLWVAREVCGRGRRHSCTASDAEPNGG